MDNKTKVKPGSPSATPGAATSVESIAPEKQENQYASGGEHQEQKKELKKSVKKGDREGHPAQSPGQHSTGSYTGTTGGQG
ncbi:MAG TPA: hypothetical protein VF126_12685 [Acidobacteriaceae bacterium]